VLVGAGTALLGVGIYEGINTLSIKKDADNICGGPPENCKDATAKQAAATRKHDAVLPSWLATGGIVLGAAGIGVGIFLIATNGSPPVTVSTGSVRMTPTIGPGSVGLTGSF
jgi:hypothetical protein